MAGTPWPVDPALQTWLSPSSLWCQCQSTGCGNRSPTSPSTMSRGWSSGWRTQWSGSPMSLHIGIPFHQPRCPSAWVREPGFRVFQRFPSDPSDSHVQQSLGSVRRVEQAWVQIPALPLPNWLRGSYLTFLSFHFPNENLRRGFLIDRMLERPNQSAQGSANGE